MKAMILTAGEGTRLAPLTDDLPKALFLVGDRPIILYLFEILKQHGIKEIILNLHHLGDQIEEVLGDGSRYSVRLTYSREDELMGTGGGIQKARRTWGKEDILVINGDNLLDLNIGRLLLYQQAADGVATMVLKPMGSHQKYTPVYLDNNSNVEEIGGKERATQRYAFIGVQVLSPAFLDYLPASRPSCLIKDGYKKVLRSRKASALVKGFITAGYWREISTFEGYWEANMDFLKGRLPAYFYRGREEFTRRGFHLGKDCRIGPRVNFYAPVYLGDGCTIGAGTTLGSRVLVGGATVGDGCRLQDVVIWPDSAVRKGSRWQDVIITPFGKVNSR